MALLERLRSRARKGENGRARKIFELLETRIVLDAAMHADLDKDHQDNTAATEQNAQGAGGAADVWGGDQGQGQLPDMDLKVVIVSDSLGDISDIYNAVSPDTKVIVLDSQHDDLASLNAKIGDLVQSTGHQVGTLAILDHGAEGVLQIGGEFITLADLGSHQGEFHTLGTYLSDDAQIQLYGCDVASGDQGYLFISGIADATGASVWASDDATGNYGGADWTLEVYAGDYQYATYLFDGYRLDDAVVLSITDGVNDTPVIVPSSSAFTNVHGTPTTFTVTVNDADDPEGGTFFPMQVTLTAYHGVITLDSLEGLTFITGDGTADSTMTFQGDRGDINAALRGATYTGDASYVGHDGLNIIANDLGNTGTGGALQDSETISIEVGLPTDTITVPQATPAYSTVTTPSELFTAAQNGQFDGVVPRVPYFQGSVYFAIDPAGVGTTDWTIWRYDIASGTSTAITVPGSAGFDINSGGILELTEHGGNLLFGGYQSDIGFKIWAVDTTFNMAAQVYSHAPVPFSFLSVALGSEGVNYASGHPTTGPAYSLYGDELYALDTGTTDGRLVADIWPGSSSSSPMYLTAVGNSLYFAANGGSLGVELWEYDATTNTLTQWDINPGSGSSNPTGLVYYDNMIRFVATDGSGNRGFWQLNTATNELSLWTNDPKALSNGTYSAIYGSPIINNVEYEVGTGSVKLYSFTGESQTTTDPTTLPRFDFTYGEGATPGVGFEVGEAEKEAKPILLAEEIKEKKSDQQGVTLAPPPPPPHTPTPEVEGEARGAGLGQGGLWANMESQGAAGPRTMGSQGLAGALDPNAVLTNLVFNFDTQQAAHAFTGPNIPGEWMTFNAGNKPSLAFNADLRSIVQSVLRAGSDLGTSNAIFGRGGSGE